MGRSSWGGPECRAPSSWIWLVRGKMLGFRSSRPKLWHRPLPLGQLHAAGLNLSPGGSRCVWFPGAQHAFFSPALPMLLNEGHAGRDGATPGCAPAWALGQSRPWNVASEMAPPFSSSLWPGSAPALSPPPPACPSWTAPAHFRPSNFFPSSDLSLCLSCLRVSPAPPFPCLGCLSPALCLILLSHSVCLPPWLASSTPLCLCLCPPFLLPLSHFFHSPPTFSMSPSASLCVSVVPLPPYLRLLSSFSIHVCLSLWSSPPALLCCPSSPPSPLLHSAGPGPPLSGMMVSEPDEASPLSK